MTIRKISQIIFLLIYIILFLLTDFISSNTIKYPVNIFLRIDPLIAITEFFLFKTVIGLLIPAFVTILLTIILGRFFCGWVCPLGTIFDITGVSRNIFFKKDILKLDLYSERLGNIFKKSLKYYFLVLLLIAAIFSVQLIGFFDPISLLTRTLTISIYPTLKFFRLNFITFLIFLLIIGLSIIKTRLWCVSLCPLGALLGVISKFALLKRNVNKKCVSCKKCQKVCGLETIDEKFKSKKSECNFCLNCSNVCSKEAIEFNFNIPKPFIEDEDLNLSRRYFITSVMGGIILSPLIKLNYNSKSNYDKLLRPPGALPEEEFLDRCVRCGQCLKVCPTNIIQPAFLEVGLESFYSPIMAPRIGYCDYECSLCGQVCPTGAIPNIPLEEKQRKVMGTAVFNKNRCLPWYKNVNCLVCEEHCPIPSKAIRFNEKEVMDFDGQRKLIKFPYVVEYLCLGCGLCEYKCPVSGDAGITVRKAKMDIWE
ncbi:MAG: 4Fe-4S binding protein [Candidatus Firestonebacteria bacterium]